MSNPFPFPSNEAILAGSKQHAEADFALSVQLAECRAEIERLRAALAAPQPEPTKGDPLGLCALPCGHDGPHDMEAAPQPEPLAGLREALERLVAAVIPYAQQVEGRNPIPTVGFGVTISNPNPELDTPDSALLAAVVVARAALAAAPSSPLDVERLADGSWEGDVVARAEALLDAEWTITPPASEGAT